MKTIFTFLTVALLGILLMACVPKSPRGSVIVMDKTGTKPLAGVKVELFATVMSSSGPVTADLKANGITDSQGKVIFTFKNPCIMDVRATVQNCNATYCSGSGIIKFEEGKTNQKTIYINN